MLRNIQHGLKEMKNSIFKAGYLEACRKYCPSLEIGDLLPYEAGIRAQAVMKDGTLVHDFLFLGNCPHAPRLQCTVTCRYLRHPDRRNDRWENRWPLTH